MSAAVEIKVILSRPGNIKVFPTKFSCAEILGRFCRDIESGASEMTISTEITTKYGIPVGKYIAGGGDFQIYCAQTFLRFASSESKSAAAERQGRDQLDIPFASMPFLPRRMRLLSR